MEGFCKGGKGVGVGVELRAISSGAAIGWNKTAGPVER